jgi:hypothetical protein
MPVPETARAPRLEERGGAPETQTVTV